MAIAPRSFLRNPLLLVVLGLALAVPLTLFVFGDGACDAKREAHVKSQHTVVAAHSITTRVDTVDRHAPGWLGIRIQTNSTRTAKMNGDRYVPGVLVVDVRPNNPGQIAGIRDGDVVTHFRGRRIVSACQLRTRVGDAVPGTRVPLRVVRDGHPVKLSPMLGARPESSCGCK